MRAFDASNFFIINILFCCFDRVTYVNSCKCHVYKLLHRHNSICIYHVDCSFLETMQVWPGTITQWRWNTLGTWNLYQKMARKINKVAINSPRSERHLDILEAHLSERTPRDRKTRASDWIDYKVILTLYSFAFITT